MKLNSLSQYFFKRLVVIEQTELEKSKGLTLIECLVAIAVIAASLGVIAPVTVLSVATRVQNQRAEQATHIAQSEVDKIRLRIEKGGDYDLNDVAPIALAASETMEDVDPPDSVSDTVAPNHARGIDIDSDGDDDFAVQIFRTNLDSGTIDGAGGQPVAFELGVRVYRVSAVGADSDSRQASLTMTSGEGQGTNRPLSVVYTTIVKSDRKESLCGYYLYMDDDSATTPGSCTSP